MQAIQHERLGGPEVLQVVRLPVPLPRHQHASQGLTSGAITPPIETMPLSEAAAAPAKIEAQLTMGKVILVP